jgi:cbb3-type cytochrome oxidase maturation protein
MASLYLLIPLGVVVVGGAIALFAWAVNSGQFDDLSEISRRLPDDEP